MSPPIQPARTPTGAAPVGESTAVEGRWREYEHLTSLYQFYLDLTVKAAGVIVVGVTTLSTVVLANADERPEVAWALLPIALLVVGLAFSAPRMVCLANQIDKRLHDLAESLEAGLAPHVQILITAIRVGGILAGIAGALLIALWAVVVF